MSRRWILTAAVAAAVIVVALLALPLRERSGDGDSAAAAASGGSCAANAPAANLNFTLKDMNGKDVRLADYKGKVILLNFWATWCPPCKLEIPAFVELERQYKDKGLVILGVSIDDPIDKLPPFAKEYDVNYPLLVGQDREDIQDAYGPMFGIPVSVLIGRNGKVCGKHMGLVSADRDAIKQQFEREIQGLL